jgi:hypothetical protein
MKYGWDSSGAHAPFCVAASRKKVDGFGSTISVSHTYRSEAVGGKIFSVTLKIPSRHFFC